MRYSKEDSLITAIKLCFVGKYYWRLSCNDVVKFVSLELKKEVSQSTVSSCLSKLVKSKFLKICDERTKMNGNIYQLNIMYDPVINSYE